MEATMRGRTASRLVGADGTVVADYVEVAASLHARALGLMFRRELAAGRALWIAPCNSIHMFFMRFPIDVAFLDRDGRVLRVYDGIRPWRVSRIVRGAKVAVELPAGTLAAAGVRPGDVLRRTEVASAAA